MKIQGINIVVDTASHPILDAIGIAIEPPLLLKVELSIFLDFPFNHGHSKFSASCSGI
jgi:hypothetical protein